jgi:hypothetical protein
MVCHCMSSLLKNNTYGILGRICVDLKTLLQVGKSKELLSTFEMIIFLN